MLQKAHSYLTMEPEKTDTILNDIDKLVTMDPVKVNTTLNEIDKMLVEGYDNQMEDIKGTLLFVILLYLTYFFVNLKIE